MATILTVKARLNGSAGPSAVSPVSRERNAAMKSQYRKNSPYGQGNLFENIRQVKLIFLVSTPGPFVFPDGTDQPGAVAAVIVTVKL